MKPTTSNYFAQLNSIDVSSLIEKKGQYSYLSWPHAVKNLREFDPASTWEVKRFDGKPFLHTDLGFFVEVAVTCQGVTLSQIHPVLDARNRPMMAPSSFDINTSIQRCLVKAIGLHGLGLSIYAGEDVPASMEIETLNDEQQANVKKLIGEVGGDLNRLLTYFKVEKLSDIPVSDYDRVLRSLQRGRKQREAVPAASTRVASLA